VPETVSWDFRDLSVRRSCCPFLPVLLFDMTKPSTSLQSSPRIRYASARDDVIRLRDTLNVVDNKHDARLWALRFVQAMVSNIAMP
jgi:hypothetical protein